MRILIVTPASQRSTQGNQITAKRWALIIRKLGHRVVTHDSLAAGSFDAIIALHARKSARSVFQFKIRFSDRPVLVAMTGTDLHVDLGRSELLKKTLVLADRIILLEPEGGKILERKYRKKTRVIYQSATPLKHPPTPLKRCFEVSVIGHLRDVKDPFRTAAAARLLPDTSRVRIVHFGAALTQAMETQAVRESQTNPRYRWFGAVSHYEAKRRLSRSRLTVLSSRVEGAPAVISEAIVNRVPILATRIPATLGLLGTRYPGLFEYGNTVELANLIDRAETDQVFYRRLIAAGEKLITRFSPQTESANWKTLLDEIV